MSFLAGWKFRKYATISRVSGAVSNYQMWLRVGESAGSGTSEVHCGGLCKTDFSDLRFTNASGTVLDYWIEQITGTTPNQLAYVWVEFDSIGTSDTTFYMYYGNAGASAVSNGPNTFLLFDHFDDASFDTGKWTKTESKALTVTEPAGTYLRVGGTTNANGGWQDCFARSIATFSTSFMVGTMIKSTGSVGETGRTVFMRIRGSNDAYSLSTLPWLWTSPNRNEICNYDIDNATPTALDNTDLDNAYHLYWTTFNRSTGAAGISMDRVFKGTGTNANLANTTLFIELGAFARLTGEAVFGDFDYVFIRNWESVEPAWVGSWSSQQLASFSSPFPFPRVV